MLPPYYALLRLCCRRSSAFARTLAQHQNIHWAFRNIAPHAHLYPGAAEELLRLARILAARSVSNSNNSGNNGSGNSGNGSGGSNGGNSDSGDGREATAFRRSTLSAYLQGLNGRTCWTTLISAFCTLVENEDDRLYVVYNGGLQMTFEALHSLHAVYSESGNSGGVGTAGVRTELTAALRWARALCRTLRTRRDAKEARALLLACKDWPECSRRLLTMINLHHRHNHLRNAALGVLREVVMIGGAAALGALVPLAAGAHCAARQRHAQVCAPRTIAERNSAHRLATSYLPYHKFIDTCCRVARNQRCMSDQLVLLSALCALEAVPLKFNLFAAFWTDIASSPADAKLEEMFLECSVAAEYVDAIMFDERDSLEDPVIFQFMQHYYSKLGSGAMITDGSSGPSSSGTPAAAEALVDEIVALAPQAPMRVLLPPVRALQLVIGRSALQASRAKELLQAIQTANARIQLCAEEDNSEPESESAAAVVPRAPSASGSDGEDAPDDITADASSSDSDENPPRVTSAARRTQLSLALASLEEQASDTSELTDPDPPPLEEPAEP